MRPRPIAGSGGQDYGRGRLDAQPRFRDGLGRRLRPRWRARTGFWYPFGGMFDWDDIRSLHRGRPAQGPWPAQGQKLRLGMTVRSGGASLVWRPNSNPSCWCARRTACNLTAAGAQLLELGAWRLEAAMEQGGRGSPSKPMRWRASSGSTLRRRVWNGAARPRAAHAVARPGPALGVELAAHAGFLSASRREVDMAITLSPPSEKRLAIEPLATYQLALYAAPAYLERAGAPRSTRCATGASARRLCRRPDLCAGAALSG